MHRPKIIVIVGPTSSGKSALAVDIARIFDGEIISADSRQVYKELSIGTAKIPKKERGDIPHFCIDNTSVKNIYTAHDFIRDATSAISDILKRKKTPIVIGGTGFWIDTLICGAVFPAVPPNPTLRKTLEKKKIEELLDILKTLDPKRASSIDQKNPRRIMRAIEIANALGRVPPLKKNSKYTAFWIGIHPSKDTLKNQIKKRAKQMIRNGLLKETKKLLRNGISPARIRELGFEYTTAHDVIIKKLSKTLFTETLAIHTLKYAKRQMTWFKRNKKMRWITSPDISKNKKLTRQLSHFLSIPRKRNKEK